MSNTKKVKKDGFLIKTVEEILYICFVLFGFYLAFLIKFNMNPSLFNIQPFFDSIPYIVITSIIIFYMYDIVSTLKKSFFENVVIIGLSLVLIDIITVAIVFFMRGFAFPRSIFLIGFFIQFILICVTKIIILIALKKQQRKQDILIIAPQEDARYIARKILEDKHNIDKIKYLSGVVDQSTYKLIGKVKKVYVGADISSNDKSKLIQYCSTNNKTVYLVPSLFEIALADFKVTQMSDMLLFKIEDLGLPYEQRVMKRTLDLIISIIGVVLVSPIMIIVAIIIKFYDKGPVLFKQERVTQYNKTFNLYKFRTMIIDAEKHTGPVLAIDKDPRITPLGNFLRASRIDELPQLFNVLRGDMSIVGPRPERPFFVEQFNEEIEDFRYRTFVKAGVTGLAQVLGKYSTDPKDKAKYDLLYIKSYSLILDIKLIFNTVKIMFIKDSSAGVVKDQNLDKVLQDLDL